MDAVNSTPDKPSMAGMFPNAGAELGVLIRGYDWSATPLGPIEGWPQSLRTVTEMLLLSPVPIVLLWGEDGIMIYNDAYSVFAGSRHPQLLGSKVREGWVEVADFNDNVMRVGMAGKTLAYRDQELTLHRHGRPESVWMNLDYSPVLGETGAPAGVIAIVTETTDRVLAERRVRESEMRFRALTNATSDVIYRMSPDWREMRQLDGRSLLADVDQPKIDWRDTYLLPDDRAEVQTAIDRAISNKEPFQLEHRVKQADGSVGWMFSRSVPILDGNDEIIEWFGSASDVTERRRANEHLRLVINELNHRVKNMLSMVQAIALRTFREAADFPEAQERFAARLIALAQANDLLTGERWAGASIHDAISQAVTPHRHDADRVRIGGPNIRISPKTALALALAMHELSTNAVKYGAWSNDRGTVEITWAIENDATDGRRLEIVWQERGGPTVAPPTTRGFGSRLIERGLAGEMNADVTLQFEPEGVRCVIAAPLTFEIGG
jgi:two-component sensor histidine kinase/PAS domain-containing protein